METLKMKFKLHSLEFEIEGKEATVKEEFQNFKNFVTGELLSKINVVVPPVTTISAAPVNQFTRVSDFISLESEDFPHIDDVKRNLECSEAHWMLVFAFYESGYGKNYFSREKIQQIYKMSRDSGSRMSNFLQNWNTLFKTDNRLIKTIKENEFLLTDKGIETAQKLIKGEITSKAAKEKPSKNKSAQKGEVKSPQSSKKAKTVTNKETLSIDKNLNLRPKDKKSFKEFYEEKQPGPAGDFNTVAIYYLTKILELSSINLNHIYTCYKEVNKKVPTAFAQSIFDIASRKGYIDSSDMNNLKLPLRGENFVEHDLPKKVKKR